jgi:hypothetical protein
MSLSPELVARAMYHATKGEGGGQIARVDAAPFFTRPSASVEIPSVDAMMAGLRSPARDDSYLRPSPSHSGLDYN